MKKEEKKVKEVKIYKEPNKAEEETTINVLYEENVLSIYTNKVELQRQLNKIAGEPSKEYKKGKSILASNWNIPLSEKTKISKKSLFFVYICIKMYTNILKGEMFK